MAVMSISLVIVDGHDWIRECTKNRLKCRLARTIWFEEMYDNSKI